MRIDRLGEMRQYILKNGTASLDDLSRAFNISTNTVRRDIAELTHDGQIKKVYGGVAVSELSSPLPLSVRAEKNREAKQEIGRLAATLVPDDATVFLDSGSTTVCILPYLADKKNITVVTHSLTALCEAAKYPSLQVIALGGVYSAPTSSFVGFSTLDTLSRMSISIVFIAATGVSVERGLTNTTYLEAEIKRNVVRRSDRIVLVADESKFGNQALFTFCGIADLSEVVTNAMPTPEYLDLMQANNVRLLCVK